MTQRACGLMPLASRPWVAAGLVVAAAACAAPQPPPPLPVPLRAPVPSPPGDLRLEERILWWEARLPSLMPEDRSEANLLLGELYLEAGRGGAARQAFREAEPGPLSREEEARVARGIGLSYLLDGHREAARPHLEEAVAGLEPGPQRAECELLLRWIRGEPLPASTDPLALDRLRPYFGGAVPALAQPASARPASLVDLRREDWGASATRGNHEPMGRIWRLTVHHSAEPLVSEGVEATKAEARRIQKNHLNHQPEPWADIGYHFLIDRAGRVVEGRPLDIQGAHAGGDFNRGNVGICVLGNFASQPERGPEFARAQSPTAAQLRSLEDLVDALRERYGIARAEVWPHDHFRVTECPGPALSRWVESYRRGAPGLVPVAAP